uniref:Uncharacterized protein n=1 Tax=Chromera velia CCMP2878 TaxID=1169474 RepID=A0A0G4HAT0_9ALVE|eukprot:Cvel_25633.t1-p1 / transcript=Cvel_25633.t1 / gene=Cvel_25633 / organism=Chromera_velia_CCMP2878 / gene_product=hypothetical protein / transcript_product=hypothetical protein / location=Cvel_scaffold2931:18564-18881(+) / protein_length=106 / sequence_SO=supercontig / SO=protein_coding / is_pseudo=false
MHAQPAEWGAAALRWFGAGAVGESSHPAGAYASPWTVPTTAVPGEPSPVVTAPATECTPKRDVLHDWGQDRQEGEIDHLPWHSEWHPDPCPLRSRGGLHLCEQESR